jgi:flagellar protein FlaG
MIDGVSLTGETLVINKGEGSVPSPPPSSSQSQRGDSGQAAAEVELSFTQEARQTKTNSNKENAKQLEQSIKAEVEQTARNSDLEKQMQETIQALNEKLGRLDREVLFKVDKRNDRNYISVIDKNSKEIIREFPPEEIRNFIARFDDFNKQLDMSADVKSLIINLEV